MFCVEVVSAECDTSFRFNADFPYFGENGKLVQDFYITSLPDGQAGVIIFSCYKYGTKESDSLFVYGQKMSGFR
jgi:hypothetical protein